MKSDNWFIYILAFWRYALIALLSGKFSWDICPVRGFLSFLLFVFLWGVFISLFELVYQIVFTLLFDRWSK